LAATLAFGGKLAGLRVIKAEGGIMNPVPLKNVEVVEIPESEKAKRVMADLKLARFLFEKLLSIPPEHLRLVGVAMAEPNGESPAFVSDDFIIDPVDCHTTEQPATRKGWFLTTLTYYPGSFNPRDGGTPPETVDKEIGVFSSLSRVFYYLAAERLVQQVMDLEEEWWHLKVQDEEEVAPDSDPLCPHNQQFHECTTCLARSDELYDSLKESRFFY